MAKKELLSRFNLRDYNKELEEVLEEKDFQSQEKNLLLSMLYKIEIGYKDYTKIKRDSLPRETFLENIIRIIKEKCNIIELIRPNEEKQDEKKYYAIIEDNKIGCYQNEQSVLHALLELDKKNFIIQNEEMIIKQSFKNMLKEGYELDIKEVVTNFDGWSWNNNIDKNDRIDCFLIYEILRIIMGNSFLNEWKEDGLGKKDYLNEIRKKSKDMFEEISKYCIISNCDIQFIKCELKKTKNELSRMENKADFLEKKYAMQKELSNKIKETDKILSNRKMLKDEFIKRNKKLPEESKIFSVSDLEELLQNERIGYISEKEIVNRMLEPKNYVRRMEKLKECIDIVEQSGYKNINNEKAEKELINMQLAFIEYLRKVIMTTEDKKELQELMNKFRYYLYLPIKINGEIIEIKNVPELKQELEKIEKKIITKACKQKALIIINQDINYNAKIIQKILDTKQIDLLSITAVFNKEKDDIKINVFDGEVLDRTETIKKDKEKDFRVKFDKKIKLFI